MMSEWQPIETAPKVSKDKHLGPPIVALASDSGHRAVGYWGKGTGDVEGWINPHDHRRMAYWNAFVWWMPLPAVPKARK